MDVAGVGFGHWSLGGASSSTDSLPRIPPSFDELASPRLTPALPPGALSPRMANLPPPRSPPMAAPMTPPRPESRAPGSIAYFRVHGDLASAGVTTTMVDGDSD